MPYEVCDDRAMVLSVFFDPLGLPERVAVTCYSTPYVSAETVEAIVSHCRVGVSPAVSDWLQAVAEAHKPPRLL